MLNMISGVAVPGGTWIMNRGPTGMNYEHWATPAPRI